MTLEIEEHAAEALGAALAARVAEDLRDAIAARGRAGLAVPGGETPRAFLAALGEAALDWERVAVTLTDERWVPLSDPRSNQRMLAETLFRGPAAAAEFVPLYGGGEPAQALPAIATALRQVVLPLDVVVLGMGEDMHTASLFPGGLGLAAAMDPDGAEPVAAIVAPGAQEPRVTLTLAVLHAARRRYILIRGAAKRAALERAAETADPLRAPVRAVLDAPGGATVFHAE